MERLKNKICLLITKLLGDKEEMVCLPVLRGPLKGARFRLDLIYRKETSYFLGTYDPDKLKKISRFMRKGMTIWDCGAYLGYYTVFFARFVGPEGKVVVFEPDPRNMLRIKENIGLNNLKNVQFIPVAIGARLGETDFILSNNTNSHLPGTYVGATRNDYAKIERRDEVIRVACVSLDEACGNKEIPRPDLIKIDIDGAEIIALESARHLANEVRPVIALELHNPQCDAAAWQFAQEYNYRLKSLDTDKFIQRKEEVRGTLLCLPLKSLKGYF